MISSLYIEKNLRDHDLIHKEEPQEYLPYTQRRISGISTLYIEKKLMDFSPIQREKFHREFRPTT